MEIVGLFFSKQLLYVNVNNAVQVLSYCSFFVDIGIFHF